MASPSITRIENVFFAYEIHDLGRDYNGFNQVYEKGAVAKSTACVVRLHTSLGVTGVYSGGPISPAVANYLLGKNPFQRERIYNDLKRGLRHTVKPWVSGH